ncbi:MAG: tetratricopeptide repeat protein [Gemmatimonadaceae bacterium]
MANNKAREGALAMLIVALTMSCGDAARSPAGDRSEFVGSARCADCHASEHEAWQKSPHALAMQKAQATSVLGRFDSTRFRENGVTSTFFRRGERYFVNTQGEDGKLHDYEIRHTFGVSPLQQYLVDFPRGRMQVLAIAWDTRPAIEGGQRWFSLNPDRRIAPTDDDHWSRRLYNWNFRCADCHSTAVRKNYDGGADQYHTTYSEISVGCEACHGPGARHATWAAYPAMIRMLWPGGQLPARLTERHGVAWVRDEGSAIARRTSPRTTEREIETCAQCHSRRIHIAEGYTAGEPLLDYYIPFLIEAGSYYPDGQQLDEVYNHGSFLQSRMYRAGVTCGDCHDPHSQRLRQPGPKVCLQCHDAAVYDGPAHHFHGPQTGATCITCHMPTRTYMQVDARHDHGFAVPRPDLSVALDVPNACTQCHVNRDALWADREWRLRFRGAGPRRFAYAFEADERGEPGAAESLARVAKDSSESAIIRASALARLAHRPDSTVFALATRGAQDPDQLVRLGALAILESAPAAERIAAATPLLRDRRRALRQGAAWLLASVADSLDAEQRRAFAGAAAEFVASQRYNADQPEHRWALGTFYGQLRHLDSAAVEYRAAVALAPRFAQAYVDLAEVLRVQGRMTDAEQTLRRAIAQMPEDAGMHYALGQFLLNQGRAGEAIGPLQRAIALRPNVPEFRAALTTARTSARRGNP